MMRRCVALRICERSSAAWKALAATWNLNFGDQPLTNSMDFHIAPAASSTKMFHVLDVEGNVDNAEGEPKIDRDTARKMLKCMLSTRAGDEVLLNAQRTGEISFYMTSFGEEALVGSAAAFSFEDYLFMQYREAITLHYRDWSWKQIIAQCKGNLEDPAMGRQMPMHFGSPKVNALNVSSPLATQIPQAAGAGYVYRIDPQHKGHICVCYFGEGAASEGDFHAGMNFAATRKAHTLFFCRNNAYAISTPAKDQYAGDGIVARGVGYGMPSIRVDGTDALAVYAASKRAREIILERGTPALIEAVMYRAGHHSTSDESSRYRGKEEMEKISTTFDPVRRFEHFMVKKGWWEAAETEKTKEEVISTILGELERQRSIPLHSPLNIFENVYAEETPTLKRQREELTAHYEANKSSYEGGK